jgi:hypothetical protein
MLSSERTWLVDQIREALLVKFEDEIDFQLPCTTGFRRSERLILYTTLAYESLREIVSTVQEILSQVRNNWIIWCQSLLHEGPDTEDIPESLRDFIIWIYPDKIMVTEEQADLVRGLIEWRT